MNEETKLPLSAVDISSNVDIVKHRFEIPFRLRIPEALDDLKEESEPKEQHINKEEQFFDEFDYRGKTTEVAKNDGLEELEGQEDEWVKEMRRNMQKIKDKFRRRNDVDSD